MSRVIVKFLLVVFSFSNLAQAGQLRLYKTSFSSNMERYNSVLGFFAELDRLIPARQDDSLPLECRQVTEANVGVLGANDPGVAQALEAQPGVLYFNLYQKCVYTIVNDSFSKSELSNENAQQILGESLARRVSSKPWNRIKLTDLGQEQQQQILSRFILYIVGPDIILQSKKYIGPGNVFGQDEIKNTDQLAAFLKNHVLKINEQATLSDFYSAFIIILRNGPVIKT